MKIRYFLLAVSLRLSPTLVQASDLVEHASLAILSCRQLSDLSSDRLPQDILKVLAQTLTELETYGVWINEESGTRWVPFTKIVAGMQACRDGESTAAEIMAILKNGEQIKVGLLMAASAEWARNLDDVVKEHRQDKGKLNPGKAYAASFLAYYIVELSAAKIAAWDAAYKATKINAYNGAWRDAYHAAWEVAYMAVYNAARNAARNAAWEATYNAAMAALRASVEHKVEVLDSTSACQRGIASYDLAEMFTLLWLAEKGHTYLKKTFSFGYERYPEGELWEVKAMIKSKLDGAAIDNPALAGNMFLKALWRDLEAMESFLLAKDLSSS